MRADPKLEFKILELAEKLQGEHRDVLVAEQIKIRSYEQWQIFEAVRQLADAGKLVHQRVRLVSNPDVESFVIEGVTTSGHQAIAELRSQTFVARAKRFASSSAFWKVVIATVLTVASACGVTAYSFREYLRRWITSGVSLGGDKAQEHTPAPLDQ